ncbi:hypothetical protein VQ7734_04801 [Vibrio quintilis]|uniref:Uncharacterized protein n=1 Tax=Vibrio quintilis TaxID=1117707 RepID=A0A1M7Z2K1_9VIBR|nr:hypothetical protein VQ7734_04801 [Vibrio quintilis]
MDTKMKQSINIGVDTGKTLLDIHIRPIDHFFSVENTPQGIKQALQVIKKHSPERIVIEATAERVNLFCTTRKIIKLHFS